MARASHLRTKAPTLLLFALLAALAGTAPAALRPAPASAQGVICSGISFPTATACGTVGGAGGGTAGSAGVICGGISFPTATACGAVGGTLPAGCDTATLQEFAADFGAFATSPTTAGPVSLAAAQQFLVQSGVPDSLAVSFLASFTGPISARIVLPGESFYRYTATPTSRGSFLTKSLFSSPGEAITALALGVTGNAGTFRQTVTALQCTIVLEGAIAGGGPGEIQTLAPNRDAFAYSLGLPF